MRWLLAFLMAWFVAGGVAAQARTATVELDSGRVLRGKVMQLDGEKLVLQLADGTEETLRATSIHRCRFDAAQPPPPRAAETDPVGEVAADDAADGGGPGNASLLARRLHWLDQRFAWLAPNEPLQWISLAATLFALIALGIHLASRIAGSDLVHFGRAILLSASAMIVAFVELVAVPWGMPLGPGVVALNCLLAVVLLRVVYELGIGGALVGLVALLVEAGVGWLVLLLLDSILRSIGGDWVLTGA